MAKMPIAIFVKGEGIFRQSSMIKSEKNKGSARNNHVAGTRLMALADKRPKTKLPITMVGKSAGLFLSVETIVINSFMLKTLIMSNKAEKTVCPNTMEPIITATNKIPVIVRLEKLFTFKLLY